MKLVFPASTVPDLIWFRMYYTSVFPMGSAKAKDHYRKTRLALLANPLLGRPIENTPNIRELIVPQTPFSWVYYLEGDEIRVIRIWDGRRKRPVDWEG